MIARSTLTSIIIAVTIIVGTLFYVEHPITHVIKEAGSSVNLFDTTYVVRGIADINTGDHILGDKDAPVVLIEYSDYTCVLCSVMRDVFSRLVKEESIQVVYRHYYPNGEGVGFERAIAAECVARQAGEDAFFSYSDFLYKNQFDITDEQLITEAIDLGVDTQLYKDCLEDRSIKEKIREGTREARRIGAPGTPYIIIVQDNVPLGVAYANNYDNFLRRIYTVLNR